MSRILLPREPHSRYYFASGGRCRGNRSCRGFGSNRGRAPRGSRGSSTQWATAWALRRRVERNGRPGKGRNLQQNRGRAEPRTTVRSQCSVNHPGHHAGVHATRIDHEAHATRNQQRRRPAHAQPTEWGSVCGGRPGQRVEHQGTWASRTRKCNETQGGGLQFGGVESNCKELREIAGKLREIAGKLRYRKQSSLTLKVQQYLSW